MINQRELDSIQFGENGLVPVVAQAADTLAVLMLAYANREALTLTLETGEAHYFSRSRQKIWRKGETSGHVQRIADIRYDCDRDALLYSVYQEGPACHTGRYSCFDVDGEIASGIQPSAEEHPLAVLQRTITSRRTHPVEGSYTQYLFTQGLDKILKKVGEESAEVIIAAKNHNPDEVRYETADLLYHVCVLLTELGLTWEDVYAELKGRQK